MLRLHFKVVYVFSAVFLVSFDNGRAATTAIADTISSKQEHVGWHHGQDALFGGSGNTFIGIKNIPADSGPSGTMERSGAHVVDGNMQRVSEPNVSTRFGGTGNTFIGMKNIHADTAPVLRGMANENVQLKGQQTLEMGEPSLSTRLSGTGNTFMNVKDLPPATLQRIQALTDISSRLGSFGGTGLNRLAGLGDWRSYAAALPLPGGVNFGSNGVNNGFQGNGKLLVGAANYK